MDGYEFCKIVKSQLETSHVPVILLTALSSNENRILGMDIGADAYLTKPFEEKVLLSQVSNLISQRNRVQQNFKNVFLEDKTFEAGNLDNYFLNKLNKIIEARYTNEEFTVEELATEIGLSRSQLHRKLVNLTNRSTSEYIRLYRIKKASELLSTNQYQVDEIAYRVGFNSPSYFSTCFKNVYNVSPKEYMKSNLV
jgi:AraC-like DNA-binding protein